MKKLLLLIAVNLGACAPGISGLLESSDGKLALSSDAKVNVTRLDPTPDSAAAPEVFIGDVEADGSFNITINESSGEYLVEAVVPGYVVASQKVKLSENSSLKLKLEPVGKPSVNAIGTNLGLDTGVGSGGASLTPPKF